MKLSEILKNKEMRIIKFRVWDKKNRQWIYPCDIHELCFEKKGRWYLTNCIKLGYKYDHDINNVTSELSQCLELPDKNNREIYELDILRWTDVTNEIAVVRWWDGDGCFGCDKSMDNFDTVSLGGFTEKPTLNGIDCARSCGYEVIGDIKTNPELQFEK